MNKVADNPKTMESRNYIEAIGSHVRFMALWAATMAYKEYLRRLHMSITSILVPSSEWFSESSSLHWARARMGLHGSPSRFSQNRDQQLRMRQQASSVVPIPGAPAGRAQPTTAPGNYAQPSCGCCRCSGHCISIVSTHSTVPRY